MITEVVLGELRQVFDFSKPDVPAKFYAPVRIGSGVRDRVRIARAKSLVATDAITMAIQTMMAQKKKPNGMPLQDWIDQVTNEAQEMLIANINADNIGNEADMKLATLETVLTPAQDSISVKTWYESYSEESEVESVLSFLEPSVTAKIETAPLQTNSGKASKVKAKRGGR